MECSCFGVGYTYLRLWVLGRTSELIRYRLRLFLFGVWHLTANSQIDMDYSQSKEILKDFYNKNLIIENFERDNQYLETAFNATTEIWLNNLARIKEVRYLMIAEAPLWGSSKNYIYNPTTQFTQFFHKGDLEYILNITIKDKADFINRCNEIGLLVIDISPFPLNTIDTSINYRTISKFQYRELVEKTIPVFFEEKIKAISFKKSDEIKVFFRYARVQRNFQDLIAKVLIRNLFIRSETDIMEIFQQGGGIDKLKFKRIIPSVSESIQPNRGIELSVMD